MFTRTLQNGCMGGDVATLQRLLNQKIKAGLTVDGAFGPKTAAALKQYQTAQGLPATGTCNFSLWNTLVSKPAGTIPAKTVVTVDEMMQGMCAGLVVEWYHIPNYGWVNSQYVQFTNAYRLTVSNPTSPSAVTVNIYDAANPSRTIYTMHAGDWVISNNPNPVNGYIQVQVVNQFTGQALKGLVNASQVKLTAIH
jgi:mannosyl-glycoprotein endo-beta-N-acetylglucosaminidase